MSPCELIKHLKCPVGCLLCDYKIPIELKGNFYKIAMKLDILYGIEFWVVKKQHVHQISVVENLKWEY